MLADLIGQPGSHFPYQQKDKIEVHGLPNGVEFLEPNYYAVGVMRVILDAADSISFTGSLISLALCI
jgi:hypothetical protein